MLGNLGGDGRVESTAEFKGGDWSGAVMHCEGRLRGAPLQAQVEEMFWQEMGGCVTDCVG